MLKRLLQILCLLPICATGSAYAVDCASNEFKYIDNNNNETCIENKFQITTTNDTSNFIFHMSARGTFYIDWGDGTVEMINRTGTTMTEYTHNYASANEYIIKFGGRATGYSTATVNDNTTVTGVTIIFGVVDATPNNTRLNLAKISGSLGTLFPTIGTGNTAATQPRFANTFRNCTNLGDTDIDDPNNTDKKYAIPPTLFSGISGTPRGYMFSRTFQGCSGLTGTIPGGLFGNVSGRPYNYMFYHTFSGCSGLTGPIPGNLFSNISGIAMACAFRGTFYNCSGLTGAIPGNLFSGVSGASEGYIFFQTFEGCTGLTGTDIDDPNNPGMKYAIPPTLFGSVSGVPKDSIFYRTFHGCSGLTGSIPGNLFSGISGKPAASMFYMTFHECSGLTGTIPAGLFSGVIGAPAASMFNGTFQGCSGLTGTDVDDPHNPGQKYAIPPTLFSGISGAPTTSIFYRTFEGCSGLTGSIPGGLFSGIVGKPANYMFYGTFSGASNLTGTIPGTLFAGISGAPAYAMFYETFAGCSGLGGTDIDDPDQPGYKYAIPPTLFSGISGAPADMMYNTTFTNCSGLSGTIPGNLFAGISGAPAYAMFNKTFRGCSNLTGSIPSNLFAAIHGKAATYMFYATFYGCTKIGKDAIGGTSAYYIPPELFAGIDKTSVTSDMMITVFANTGLLTTCPSGTNQYITGFESYFNGKKSCTECPVAYPDYDTTNQQCYAQVSYMDSDNDSLYKTENVYYDANNPNGFNLPSYTPTNNPDTVFNNWELGDGTAIASNDVLAGNQVVYTKWRFHCDSGHYFHAGNEQICTAETKRTTYALVIKPDANHTYYIHATPNSEHDYTINSSSIHKMKVNYNGTIYNLHDASVYYDN